METAFVILGLMFAGVRWLPLHPLLHYQYFMLHTYLGI